MKPLVRSTASQVSPSISPLRIPGMKRRDHQALKNPEACRYKAVRFSLVRKIPQAAGRFRILLDCHEVLSDAFAHQFPVRRLLKRILEGCYLTIDGCPGYPRAVRSSRPGRFSPPHRTVTVYDFHAERMNRGILKPPLEVLDVQPFSLRAPLVTDKREVSVKQVIQR